MKKTVMISLAVVVCILISVVALNYLSYQAQIFVNDTVYTQTGDHVAELPDNSVELGYLKGITHRSTDHPSKNFTAANLDEKYAGCPIYQSGDIIHLKDYDGFFIPFELAK